MIFYLVHEEVPGGIVAVFDDGERCALEVVVGGDDAPLPEPAAEIDLFGHFVPGDQVLPLQGNLNFRLDRQVEPTLDHHVTLFGVDLVLVRH